MTSYLADRWQKIAFRSSSKCPRSNNLIYTHLWLPGACFVRHYTCRLYSGTLLSSLARRDSHRDCLASSRSFAAFARALLHTNLDLLATNVATDCGHFNCPTRRWPQSWHTALCSRRLVSPLSATALTTLGAALGPGCYTGAQPPVLSRISGVSLAHLHLLVRLKDPHSTRTTHAHQNISFFTASETAGRSKTRINVLGVNHLAFGLD